MTEQPIPQTAGLKATTCANCGAVTLRGTPDPQVLAELRKAMRNGGESLMAVADAPLMRDFHRGFEACRQMALDALMKLSADASVHAAKPNQPHSWHEAFTRDAECYDEARDLIRAMEPPHAE